MKPIYVREFNEVTGEKFGILCGPIADGKNLVLKDCKGDLDKLMLCKRPGESEEERLSRTTFLRRARQERLNLTSGIKGQEPDATVWELKTTVGKGIVQWTTRGQCSIYNAEDPKEKPVVAMTGFSRRGKSHKDVSEFAQRLMSSDKKEIIFKQMSLRGANDQYKKGGHCTPIYSCRSYKMMFDGRRRIVVPKDLQNGLPLPMNRLYETEPWTCASESSLARGIGKTWKTGKYVKYSPRLLPPTKEYEDFNERSVIHDVLSGRPVNITCKDPRDLDYNNEKRILLSYEESLDKLVKFRVYRRLIENLSKNIIESEKVLSNLAKKVRSLDSLINFKLCYDESYYKMKSLLTVNKDTLLLSERKRIVNLFNSVKLNGLFEELGIVGGECSNELRKMLSISLKERLRHLPL